MYRRPKFLEILLDIRRDMAHESDYDTDLFAEMVRNGRHSIDPRTYRLAYGDNNKAAKRSRRTTSESGSAGERAGEDGNTRG